MLRNVLVITDGGLVLFSKEFVNALAQPRLVGSLLTAILEVASFSLYFGASWARNLNILRKDPDLTA